MAVPAKHAIQPHTTPPKTTVVHTVPVTQTLEPEATPTHAITEAEMPERIEIMESARTIVGNGAIVKFEQGSIISDRWLVAAAVNNKIAYRIATENKTPPTAITVHESRFLILNHGRGSTTIRAGERVVDPSVISAVISSGARFSDNSPDAA